MQSFNNKLIYYLLLLFATYLGLSSATQQWYTAKDGMKYFIETDLKFNYLQAVDECSRRDLQLVVINNAEKNAAIVELLNSLSEKPRFLWLDQHDEFSKEINPNRPFYSVSTGQQNTFGYWDTNEPSNRDGNEHCAEMLRNSDYKWNDINCEAPLHGYICEEYHLLAAHKTDLDEKRNVTHLTHTNTINNFKIQIQKINDINVKTRETTKSLMNVWKGLVEDINSDLPAEEKQKAFDKVTTATLQLIETALLGAERQINRITQAHATRLESDIQFIDDILSK